MEKRSWFPLGYVSCRRGEKGVVAGQFVRFAGGVGAVGGPVQAGLFAFVRASISPDNVASLRLVAQYGFVQVGEQWDEEDGRELVLEVPVG